MFKNVFQSCSARFWPPLLADNVHYSSPRFLHTTRTSLYQTIQNVKCFFSIFHNKQYIGKLYRWSWTSISFISAVSRFFVKSFKHYAFSSTFSSCILRCKFKPWAQVLQPTSIHSMDHICLHQLRGTCTQYMTLVCMLLRGEQWICTVQVSVMCTIIYVFKCLVFKQKTVHEYPVLSRLSRQLHQGSFYHMSAIFQLLLKRIKLFGWIEEGNLKCLAKCGSSHFWPVWRGQFRPVNWWRHHFGNHTTHRDTVLQI